MVYTQRSGLLLDFGPAEDLVNCIEKDLTLPTAAERSEVQRTKCAMLLGLVMV
jgi:hypothetical protein